MEKSNQTLGEFIIENQKDFQYSSGELSRIFNSIRLAAVVKRKNPENHRISRYLITFESYFAERVGFEPTDLLQSTVFKTAAFDRSAISPEVLSGIP